MFRAQFLVTGATALLATARARAQSDADPASSSQRPALRVLLGRGNAAASSPQTFTFDGAPYRGSFERLADGQIVDVVDLESYLYSVVSAEMPPSWPPAALQMQAICARTYVLQRSDPRRSYDLVPSELDQVYRGVAGETPAAVAAVDATRGRVLGFGAGFAQVAYSSCCGGHTESSADAWNGVAIPYLQGVVCTWCTASTHYRWQTTLSLDAIAARLATPLAGFGKLGGVRVAARDGSGRARAFELTTDRGTATVAGSAFRRALGSRVLPSLLVNDVRGVPGGALLFSGGGLGHGVGLCQWGARGMALAGRSVSDIAGTYFPGTILSSS